ncbi:Acid phosphatase 1 [Linum perenne]
MLLLLILASTAVAAAAIPQSTIQLPSSNYADKVYCDSWKLSVETNNAGDLATNKPRRCRQYLEEYLTGDGHVADSDMVAHDALAYAESVEIGGDGKDGWVFDLDETLISNLAYFRDYEFGYNTPVNYTAYFEWVELAKAPAFKSSLKLYNELKKLGFAIIIMSGRGEAQRNATEINLIKAGFNGWDRLVLGVGGGRGNEGVQIREKEEVGRRRI